MAKQKVNMNHANLKKVLNKCQIETIRFDEHVILDAKSLRIMSKNCKYVSTLKFGKLDSVNYNWNALNEFGKKRKVRLEGLSWTSLTSTQESFPF